MLPSTTIPTTERLTFRRGATDIQHIFGVGEARSICGLVRRLAQKPRRTDRKPTTCGKCEPDVIKLKRIRKRRKK